MSIRVKMRLASMGILPQTTHEERMELDKLIEERTGMYCDIGVEKLTDVELKQLLEVIRNKKKQKRECEVSYVA